jgi:hypothetical protein
VFDDDPEAPPKAQRAADARLDHDKNPRRRSSGTRSCAPT